MRNSFKGWMGTATENFLDFSGTRRNKAMAERGSGQPATQPRRPLTTEDLQKYILDVSGKLAEKIRHDLALALQETKSEMQGVKQRLQGLEDRVSQISDRLSQVVQAQEDEVVVVDSSAKQGRLETVDGDAFIRCFEDRSSFFKKRLREKLRLFCLSKDGRLYIAGHVPKFVGKFSVCILN